MMAKQKNPQDTTLRNNRARQREIAGLKKQMLKLAADLGKLAGRVAALEQAGGQ